jgi:hypothetical protein
LPIWESIRGSHAITKHVGNFYFGKDYLWMPLKDTAKRRLPFNNGEDTFFQRVSKLFNGSIRKTSRVLLLSDYSIMLVMKALTLRRIAG